MKRWILAAAVLLGAGGAIVWLARVNRQQAVEMARLAAENTQLHARVTDLERAAAARAAAHPEVIEESKRPARAVTPAHDPEDIIEIQQLKLSLENAKAAAARLETRAEQAEAQAQNLQTDNQRLTGSEGNLKDSLAAANQAVDALQKELKSNHDRVTQVELAYQRLRDQSSGDSNKLAQLQQYAAQLQDLQQRRDIYLSSILRRYRQITDQYRSLAGVMQAQRTDAQGSGVADLARIQDSIAMAEDDLRQLNSLNAQAARIQKKMAGK